MLAASEADESALMVAPGGMTADGADELRRLLEPHKLPACAQLTPFSILSADLAGGAVTVEFAPQPAFANHFDAVQGGFAVAMVDVVLTLAGFALVREWLPTLEIKTSFLAPLPVGPVRGEGRILKAGRRVVFADAQLSGGGSPAVIATATLMRAS